MRFALYIIALLATTQLYAQSFSDPTYTNQEMQSPRSELVAHDKEDALECGTRVASKYVDPVDEWSHPTGNQYIFESKFIRPFSWLGRQIYLRVEGASAPYTLKVNGVEVTHMQSGALPAEFDVTKCAIEGLNVVTLELSRESLVTPIEGWEQESAPRVGEVYAVSQPTLMIRDLKVTSSVMGDKLYNLFEIDIKSHALNPRTSTIHYALLGEDGRKVSFGNKDITLKMRGEGKVTFHASIPISEAWSAENPERFTLELRTQHEGRYVEYHTYKIGLRSVEVDTQSGEMKINGQGVKLVARKVSGDITIDDLKTLKNEGFNTIRISAGGFSRGLYEACDELGIYVISPVAINSSRSPAEITKGGNPSNDPRWWGAYVERAEVAYHTTQLYSSVVGFSLADSSANGYNLYESYLRLKSKKDPRPIVYFECDGEWNSDKLQIEIK